MDNNQRPHSRQKTVGSGSAKVTTGRKVNTGSRPVSSSSSGKPAGGSGSHSGGAGGTGGSGRSGGYSGSQRSGGGLLGGKLSLKTLLIIAAVILIGSFVLKGIGGQGNDIDTPQNDTDYSDSTTAPASQGSSYTAADDTVSDLARDKFVTPLGSGKDTVTIMVYMCGTDLESKYGMATKDLQEMVNADISDKVNIIVETGGCKAWKTSKISNSVNQIYKVKHGGITLLEKDAGKSAMTDPANLTAFIQYCTANYPADRNMLIFWDHGGGSLSGYGYDEKFPSSSSMTLGKINTALKNAGCKFDFIGFDACLMATLETDIVCAEYADYLIGSEETEPGTGWYYTNWLSKLSKNTSMPTVEIAKNIIDDYYTSCLSASRNANITLSVVDLAEIQGTVPVAFREFATSTNEKLQNNEYKEFSSNCQGVRQFAAQNKINQVDMIDLCKRIGTAESKKLASALQGCVKYNKTTITNSNGISVFFPVSGSTGVQNAVSSYNEIGIDGEYSKCIKSFASLLLGGQITGSATQIPGLGSLLGGGDFGSLIGNILGGSGGSGSSGGLDLGSVIGSVLGGSSGGNSSLGSNLAGSLIGSLLGGGTQSSSSSTSPIPALLGTFLGGSGSSSSSSSAGFSLDPSMITNLLGAFSGKSLPQQYDWVDTELIADNAEDIAANFVDPSHITATEKDGQKVLALTDDEWKLIQTVELNVFAEDAQGYIDLGYDNVFEWTDDNDLLLSYDGTWLTLNGNVCAYYLVSDTPQDNGEWITEGRIPAILNGQLVNLRVVFTEDAPAGEVTGAYPLYEDETDVQAKGDIEITAGDEIELLCDHYDLDGNFSSAYTLGTSFTVPEEGLTLTNLALEADGLRATYRLTDIYGNCFWIEAE